MMNWLIRTSFFLTVFLGLSAEHFGDEVYRSLPMEGTVISVEYGPIRPCSPSPVSTVLLPIRLAEGVVLPDQEPPIRQVVDLSSPQRIRPVTETSVVCKPEIPDSSTEPIPPPPMPLDNTKLSELARESLDTIRGQAPGFKDALDEAMSVRPPLPLGLPDDPSVIAEPLIVSPPLVEPTSNIQGNDPSVNELKTQQAANGLLLIVTVCALGVALYCIAIAVDYRQRLMQSQVSQNSRLTPTFDDALLTGFGYHDDIDLYAGSSFRRFGTDPIEQ